MKKSLEVEITRIASIKTSKNSAMFGGTKKTFKKFYGELERKCALVALLDSRGDFMGASQIEQEIFEESGLYLPDFY